MHELNTHIDLPADVRAALQEVVERLRLLLGADLEGVYLHGSLAMGCFNAQASDIDLLIAVAKPLTTDFRRQLGSLFVELSERAPAKGFELSVVTLAALAEPIYPTPYEFHFGRELVEVFRSGEFDFEQERCDPDLAGHFMITQKRGRCLFGRPIAEVLPVVEPEHYLRSIAQDLEWCRSNVAAGPDAGECAVPVYAVLNFCRVLGYIQAELILSKAEGGVWGLKELPERFRPLIEAARAEYQCSGTGKPVNAAGLKEFAEFSWTRTQAALARL